MKDASFTFSDCLDWTSAEHVLGRRELAIRGVSTDSRKTKPGELFIALKGARFNGHEFLRSAVESGAGAVLVSRLPESSSLDLFRREGVAVGLVRDAVEALQALARQYRKRFEIPVVAITGSCGKTTVKEFAATLLEDLGSVLKTAGTENNHLGVPLTLLRLRPHHRAACVEMGTSSPGEIRRLAAIASPSVGAVLNVGAAHLAMLKDLNGVLCEKWSLLEAGPDSLAVVNVDDPSLRSKAAERRGATLTYGVYEGGQIRASKIEFVNNQTMRFSVIFQGEEMGCVKVPFVGLHQVYNVLAALAIGHGLGLAWEGMLGRASFLRLPPMRCELSRIGGVWLMNDAYNANPLSMGSALEAFRALRIEGKKIFVCGDMLDLGEEAGQWHRAFAQEVMKGGLDVLITMGPLMRKIWEEIRQKFARKMTCVICVHHGEALHQILERLSPSDAVLIKGSRAMGMEKIADGLVEALQSKCVSA